VDGFRTLMHMAHGSWHNKVAKMLKNLQQQQGDEQQQQQQELSRLLTQQEPATVKLLGKYDSVVQWLAEDVLPGLERHAWLGGLHLLLSKYCAAAANKRKEVRRLASVLASAQLDSCLSALRRVGRNRLHG
jgi:hypothetical protein